MRFDLEIHGAKTADSRTFFVPGDVEGLHVHDDATTLVQKESAKWNFVREGMSVTRIERHEMGQLCKS